MRQGAVLLPWFAWLQLSEAACCRSNKCLKAIVDPASGNGIQDCSANLVVTVTPTQSTLIETITVQPTEHNTLRFTLQTTVTEATQTDVVTRTDSPVYTETVLETVTVTTSAVVNNPINARQDASTSVPAYASEHCRSWEEYVKACKCAGVGALTVTAEALPAATVTVSSILGATTVSVPSTLSLTETVYVSLTETVAMTETDTVRVTATAQLTQTVTLAPDYVTVTETTTTTVAPAATCSAPSAVGAFKAAATEQGGQSLLMYADILNGVVGPLMWKPDSPSPVLNIKNKYIWKLDADGSLALASNIPPFTVNYLAYVSTTTAAASLWVQVQPRADVESLVASGYGVKLKGCVDPATGELTLDVNGRKNILWSVGQFYVSSGDGSDLRRGECTKMHPKIQAA
ncbi:hypothetical protein NEMBOFW57_003238 [Staphylotrichum longicolle]|uniref:Uncharacterized protein n=1 Tax=Staphylotrichum longicolle TaxID=669026 RepID=A0AAD4I2H3_9PEZI|nr:hypothetical protein NEMBOFW57_003238 [Staphylotrichum longicolle]